MVTQQAELRCYQDLEISISQSIKAMGKRRNRKMNDKESKEMIVPE